MAHFTKTIRRTGILLSTAAATTAFAAHYAEAYPAASWNVSAITVPSVTRIDSRSYRHCHNLPVRVVCYKTQGGQPEAQASHQRSTQERTTDSGQAVRGQHHAHCSGLPWSE